VKPINVSSSNRGAGEWEWTGTGSIYYNNISGGCFLLDIDNTSGFVQFAWIPWSCPQGYIPPNLDAGDSTSGGNGSNGDDSNPANDDPFGDLPTDDNDDSSGGGNGDNNDNSDPNDPTDDGCLELDADENCLSGLTKPLIEDDEQEEIERCTHVNALNALTNNPEVKMQIENLETHIASNPENEDGVEMRLQGDGTYSLHPPISTGPDFTKFGDAQGNTLIVMHTHIDTFKNIPTPEDVAKAFSGFLRKKVDNAIGDDALTHNDATAMVVFDGGIYALRIDDLAKVLSTYTAAVDPGNSWRTINVTYKIEVEKKSYDECTNSDGVFICTDEEYNAKLESKFMSKFKALGMGTYKATKDASGNYSWDCLDD
jgi:hypothetical protein